MQNNQKTRHLGLKRTQQGMVLITTLVFLVMITLLVVSSMRGAWVQERIAGNMRDRQFAVAAADVGVRACEEDVKINYRTIDQATSACTNGYCAESVVWDWTDISAWDSNKVRTVENAAPGSKALALQNISSAPVYKTQPAGLAFCKNCGIGSDGLPGKASLYRCMSRATGMTGDTESVIETMYKIEKLNSGGY